MPGKVQIMENLLVDEQDEYKGRYVTTCSPTSHKVVSSSASPSEAIEKAKASGCDEPILIYIPKENENTFIF